MQYLDGEAKDRLFSRLGFPEPAVLVATLDALAVAGVLEGNVVKVVIEELSKGHQHGRELVVGNLVATEDRVGDLTA